MYVCVSVRLEVCLYVCWRKWNGSVCMCIHKKWWAGTEYWGKCTIIQHDKLTATKPQAKQGGTNHSPHFLDKISPTS